MPARALPKQSPLRIPEAAFQGAIVEYAQRLGYAVYHTRDSRRSTPGFPDLVLAGRGRVVFAELKAEGGKLKPEQRDWLDALTAAGALAFCWRPSSWAHIEKILGGEVRR